MTFPDNLKRIRKSRQLSQEALAELLDVSRQSVSKWEQGICMPEAQMLLRLSETLEVSLDALMSDAAETGETERRRPARKRRKRWILCVCALLLCAIALPLLRSGDTEPPAPSPTAVPATPAPTATPPIFTTEQDRDLLYELSTDFACAYFAQDVDAVAGFLAADFTGEPKEVCPWAGVDTFTVKGVDAISTERDNGVKLISIEFRNPDYPDSFVYLTAEFAKQSGEWKIRSFYLEG